MSAEQKDVGLSLALNFFVRVDFGFVRLFLMSQRGPPSIVPFLYFATEWMFKKSQRVPLLHFVAPCNLPATSNKFEKEIGKLYSLFVY